MMDGNTLTEILQPPAELLTAVNLLDNLNESIHQKTRLAILSTLVMLGDVDFRLLKETTGLSDGNLSTHLSHLESRGLVTIKKEFKGKRPHTTVSLTDDGREEFKQYIVSLEKIIKAAAGELA